MSVPAIAQLDDFHPRPFGANKSMVRLQTAAQMEVYKRGIENWKTSKMAEDDLETNARIVQQVFDEGVDFYDANLPRAAVSNVKQQLLAENLALLSDLNYRVANRYAR